MCQKLETGIPENFLVKSESIWVFLLPPPLPPSLPPKPENTMRQHMYSFSVYIVIVPLVFFFNEKQMVLYFIAKISKIHVLIK